MKKTLSKLLKLHSKEESKMSAIDKVNAARANNRPTSIDYITKIFGDSFIELHGDRKFGDDKAIVGGIAKLNDMPVTVIGIEKAETSRKEWKEISVLLTLRATAKL